MELDSFVVVRCRGEFQTIEVTTAVIEFDLIFALDSDIFQVQVFFLLKSILNDFYCVNIGLNLSQEKSKENKLKLSTWS